jgi:hypothetical protein
MIFACRWYNYLKIQNEFRRNILSKFFFSGSCISYKDHSLLSSLFTLARTVLRVLQVNMLLHLFVNELLRNTREAGKGGERPSPWSSSCPHACISYTCPPMEGNWWREGGGTKKLLNIVKPRIKPDRLTFASLIRFCPPLARSAWRVDRKAGFWGEVRTSPEIVLHVPWEFLHLPWKVMHLPLGKFQW